MAAFPPDGYGGAPPSPGGYTGLPITQGGYGAAPPSPGGYGAAPGGYGAAPPSPGGYTLPSGTLPTAAFNPASISTGAIPSSLPTPGGVGLGVGIGGGGIGVGPELAMGPIGSVGLMGTGSIGAVPGGLDPSLLGLPGAAGGGLPVGALVGMPPFNPAAVGIGGYPNNLAAYGGAPGLGFGLGAGVGAPYGTGGLGFPGAGLAAGVGGPGSLYVPTGAGAGLFGPGAAAGFGYPHSLTPIPFPGFYPGGGPIYPSSSLAEQIRKEAEKQAELLKTIEEERLAIEQAKLQEAKKRKEQEELVQLRQKIAEMQELKLKIHELRQQKRSREQAAQLKQLREELEKVKLEREIARLRREQERQHASEAAMGAEKDQIEDKIKDLENQLENARNRLSKADDRELDCLKPDWSTPLPVTLSSCRMMTFSLAPALQANILSKRTGATRGSEGTLAREGGLIFGFDFSKLDDCMDSVPTALAGSVSTNPFAKGAFRYAYWMRTAAPLEATGTQRHVAKHMIDVGRSPEREAEALKQGIFMHLLGDLVCREFNKKKPSSCPTFNMTPSLLFRWESPPENTRQFWSFEPLLPDGTDFTKMNNNGEVLKEEYPHAHALSHFSYEFFDRQMMMVDIQGAINGSTIILTDPAFHSTNTFIFGESNFGPRGFDTFFRIHECGPICRHLGLPSRRPSSSPSSSSSSSSSSSTSSTVPLVST